MLMLESVLDIRGGKTTWWVLSWDLYLELRRSSHWRGHCRQWLTTHKTSSFATPTGGSSGPRLGPFLSGRFASRSALGGLPGLPGRRLAARSVIPGFVVASAFAPLLLRRTRFGLGTTLGPIARTRSRSTTARRTTAGSMRGRERKANVWMNKLMKRGMIETKGGRMNEWKGGWIKALKGGWIDGFESG